MQFKTLAVFYALTAIGSAQDIDNNDVPGVCRSVCQSTVDLTTQCDAQNDDDDSGYINCVCSASNASSFVPACEACVAANDEADNDVRDIVNSCSFSTTTYNSATATSGGSSASLTPVSSVTVVTTDSAGSSTTVVTATDSSSSATGTTTTTASAGTASASAGATTGAAAPAATAGFGGLAFAVLAGLPVVL